MVILRLIFFIPVICFFGVSILAQSTTASRWSIGAVGSTDICYRTLSFQSEHPTLSFTVRKRDSLETPTLRYTSGLEIYRIFSPRLDLGIGLHFSDRGYRTVLDNLTYGNMTDPRTGFIYDDDVEVPTAITIVNHYQSLDVPIKAHYFFGHKKIRAFAGAGVAVSYLIRTRSTVVKTMADGSVVRDHNKMNGTFNTLNIFPMVSAGVDWTINEKSSLRFEPIARYGVLNIMNSSLAEYLWSYGLQIGYFFSL